MTIELTCDCGRRFNSPARLAGRTIDCSGCGRSLTIPGARSSKDATSGKIKTAPAPPRSVSRPTIAVRCRCGQQFMAPPELAGKWAKCRACGQAVEIPRPRPLPRHEPVVECSPAALPELSPLTYAVTASTIPGGLPPLPKVARAPAPEAPEPQPAPAPRWRRKRYKPLYQSSSRSYAGPAKTVLIGLVLFSATMKIIKHVPHLIDGISKATSNSNAGVTQSSVQQSTSDNLLTEAEEIAGRMERLVDELRAVRDSHAVLGVRDQVMQMETDMQLFLARARTTRVTRDIAQRFSNEYLPRIQTAANLIKMEVDRMALLLHSPSREAGLWGRD